GGGAVRQQQRRDEILIGEIQRGERGDRGALVRGSKAVCGQKLERGVVGGEVCRGVELALRAEPVRGVARELLDARFEILKTEKRLLLRTEFTNRRVDDRARGVELFSEGGRLW